MCYYKESVKISGILGEETYGSNTDAGWFFYGCDHLGVCSEKVGFLRKKILCYVKDHGEDHTSCIHHCQFLTDKNGAIHVFTMPVRFWRGYFIYGSWMDHGWKRSR